MMIQIRSSLIGSVLFATLYISHKCSRQVEQMSFSGISVPVLKGINSSAVG